MKRAYLENIFSLSYGIPCLTASSTDFMERKFSVKGEKLIDGGEKDNALSYRVRLAT